MHVGRGVEHVCIGLACGGPLQSDLRKAVALTDAVVAAAGPGAAVTPSPFNADLKLAGTLRDNHSVHDHGVGPVTVDDLFANRFEDCDHWRNVFNDGWTTRYRVDVDLPTEETARGLLPKVRAAWEAMGYQVVAVGPETRTEADDLDMIMLGDAGLEVYLEATNYVLRVDIDDMRVSAGASWSCVSAG